MLTTTATMGSPTPLMPTIPSKQQSCGTCMTKIFCGMPSMTKTTAHPMTST
jgi:positive regulator of sigma E activity